MSMYEPDHVEYSIINGNIRIVVEGGKQFPAYWSHPDIGGRFPGIVLIHDWWGITEMERRIAHHFAQGGYYVIIPDLFNGKVATTPQEAINLVEGLGQDAYACIDTALQALEHHHRCNSTTAAVGFGMGGSLAYEAAITRPEIEAAVIYYGFPQRYLSRLKDARIPIQAFYGADDPYITSNIIQRLQDALAHSSLPHEVVVMKGLARDFFSDNLPPEQRALSVGIWRKMLLFLESHLEGPARPTARQQKTY